MHTPAPALWRLRLLGAFELSDGSQHHTKLATRAAVALLARLALRPAATHPREELVDLLWPDAAPEAGRQRLRQALSSLRQVLEPATRPEFRVLAADRLSVRLVPGSVDCDVLAFERACSTGDHARAHALYAGELLPGHFEEWINDERLRLEGLFDRLHPPSATVAPPAAPAAAAQPHTAAVAPTPAVAVAGSALPSYLSRLIGADPQVGLLRTALATHRLVTLLGPGGAGKTRLAVEVAHTLSVHAADQPADVGSAPPFDFVAFVPLAACHSVDQVLAQALLSLNLGGGKDGALEAVAAALHGRRALLVLDNFEQVEGGGADLVATLAARLPLLHQLVTSRRALGVAGECELPVQGLPLPPRESLLAQAVHNPAVALFVDRARGARADFSLHDGNVAAVVDLVRQLHGMPLAIELAAARVRSLPPAQMLPLLQAASGSLAVLARPRAEGRHSSMQAAIAWSWRLLPAPVQALATALTVFGGSFSLQAAVQVCGDDSPGELGSVSLGLDELASQSMLRALPQADGSARYLMLEPVREFAAALQDAATARHLRQRHRQGWLQRGPALTGREPLTALRNDLPDLAAALQSAADDTVPDEALQILLGLWQQPSFLQFLDLPPSTLALLGTVVAACGHPALQAEGQSLLGRLLYNTGRNAEALQLAEAGLAAMSRVAPADPARQADALGTWLAMHLREHPSDPALGAASEELQRLALRTGRQDLIARCERVAGLVALGPQRDPARAEGLIRSALQRSEQIHDQHLVARLAYDLAGVALRCHRFDAALREATRAADGARRLDNRLLISMAVTLQGQALVALRQWGAAVSAFRESALIGWDQAVPLNWIHPLRSLPRALLHADQPALALHLAGFAAGYWENRFGSLPATARRDLQRAQRLGRVLWPAAQVQTALAEGRALAPAAALARVRALPAAVVEGGP